MLMERSLIWSALGLMSKQGLFPMPMDDISCRRISKIKIREDLNLSRATDLDSLAPVSTTN